MGEGDEFVRLTFALLVVVSLAASVSAQTESVRTVPDAASWATAFANPAIAAYRAIRSENPQCRISQLLVSEGIAQGIGLTLKHFLKGPESERPCAGCARDGMPSGHSWNSVIGATSGSGWQVVVGASLAVGTAGLRVGANRHTPWQALAGLGLGAGAEFAGKRLVRCGS